MAMDFICPPRSKLPIDAFCVESGRWHGRGGEAATQFSSSEYQLAGNALKVAAKGASDQSEVWQQVQKFQEKASGNAGVNVQSMQSQSSLQLSLENTKLTEMTAAYVSALSKSPAEMTDAIGCAFAVNGKVRSIDVYASHELFGKMWDKLLKSSAMEAVADLQKGKTFETPRAEAVAACMEDAAKGKSSDRKVTERVRILTKESDGNVVYETQDQAAGAAGAWVHRSYLVKDEETKAALSAGQRQERVIRQQQINAPANQADPQQRGR
jgi:hypothetical protein